MKFPSRIFLLVGIAFFVSAQVAAAQGEANPIIIEAMQRVSLDDITQDAQALTGQVETEYGRIVSRHIEHPDHQIAVEFLVGRLESEGFEVSRENFDCGSSPSCSNLIVEIPGSVHPENIWIIGAHFDSTNGVDSSEPAPGAVDNASGVVIVMQTLFALSQHTFSDTIRFILFDAEEVGLIGSGYHAEQASLRSENIILMVNLDVPGWRVPGVNAAFASSDYPSWPFLNELNRIPNRYECGTKMIGVPAPVIDSANMASFWDFDYPAFMVGSLYELTGWMNTAQDTYQKLDLAQCANVAWITTAYIAEKAGIIERIDPNDDDVADDDVDDDADDDSTPIDDDAQADKQPDDSDDDESDGCGCF
jgi:Peptidase family M28